MRPTHTVSCFFFFSSRRRHTRFDCDWSSDVCSSDLYGSTLEVLSHVQIWYVERETRELVRIQQAELLESFHKAQSNYSLSTGLAVISEISELILPEHEVSEAKIGRASCRERV